MNQVKTQNGGAVEPEIALNVCWFCRRGIALAALGGPIYAIGGLDDNSCFNDVERYDIESDCWSAVAPMNTPRGGVGSVALGVSL